MPSSGSLHAEAHAWATDWSRRWFLGADEADRMRFDQTDAGWATHVEAYLLLFDLGSELLGSGRQRGISARRWLKARGFDRALRAAALRRQPPVAPPRGEIGVVVEIPTPSMSEPAATVAAAAWTDVAVGVADPRAISTMRALGLPAVPLVLGWRDERRLVRAAAGDLAAAWADLRSHPPTIRLRDRDVTSDVLERLAPLARRSMPYLAAERHAIEGFLDAVKPTAVAMASDQHRIGRLLVAAARQREIRTVVLQHGLPQSQVGYLPVIADTVAAWSTASAAWFMDRNTPSERVVVTGNPRLDGSRSRPAPGAPKPHLLLALSPTSFATNVGLVRDALEATARSSDARLTIKLHPGQSDWSFVARLVHDAALGARVAVRRHEPLPPLLSAATVVVLHRSSVAVEALAAGRPVVVHRAGDEATTADLELAELALTVTEDAEGLAEAALRLSAPDAASAYLGVRRDGIERVTGPLDGASAQRIVRLLLAGAQ